MKKLILLLTLIPVLSFSQVEITLYNVEVLGCDTEANCVPMSESKATHVVIIDDKFTRMSIHGDLLSGTYPLIDLEPWSMNGKMVLSASTVIEGETFAVTISNQTVAVSQNKNGKVTCINMFNYYHVSR